MPILKEPKALWQTCYNRQPVPEVSEGRAGLQGSKLIGSLTDHHGVPRSRKGDDIRQHAIGARVRNVRGQALS
jgi:hypothetical protein